MFDQLINYSKHNYCKSSSCCCPIYVLDGIIDNSPATVGINGLVDALETIADNFILNYTVSDLDADSIFSYLDPDSDGDDCSDVIEAGFTDTDTDEVTVLADLKFQFSGGDKTPPVISCPADAVVECGDSTEPSATGEANADDCSDVTIDYSGDIFNFNDLGLIIEVSNYKKENKKKLSKTYSLTAFIKETYSIINLTNRKS